MSLQINIDPGNLTSDQRQGFAAFIANYPTNQCLTQAPPCAFGKFTESAPQTEVNEGHAVGSLNIVVTADTSRAMASIAALAATIPPEFEDEIGVLAKEGGEFEASVAFGVPDQDNPAAAFGGGSQAPLTLPASAAPFTVAAVPFSTVPVATPILTNPANAPIQLAPNLAPVGVAPLAPAGVSTPANSVELDKNGLPWDARIHGSTKTKNSDGTWRAKRGVDNAQVLQVNNELRQLMGVPAPLAHAPATATTLAPQAGHATMPTAGAAFSGVPAPASGLNPVAPPPPSHSAPALGAVSNTMAAPSVAPPDGHQLFVALIGRASAALQANKLTQAEVAEICARHGVPALPLLANRLDLVPTVAAEIDALIAARP